MEKSGLLQPCVEQEAHLCTQQTGLSRAIFPGGGDGVDIARTFVLGTWGGTTFREPRSHLRPSVVTTHRRDLHPATRDGGRPWLPECRAGTPTSSAPGQAREAEPGTGGPWRWRHRSALRLPAATTGAAPGSGGGIRSGLPALSRCRFACGGSSRGGSEGRGGGGGGEAEGRILPGG